MFESCHFLPTLNPHLFFTVNFTCEESIWDRKKTHPFSPNKFKLPFLQQKKVKRYPYPLLTLSFPLIIFVQSLSWIVAERGGSLQHVVTHYCDFDRPFPSCLWQLLFVLSPDHLLWLDKISVCLQSKFQQSPSSNLNTDAHICMYTCQRQWQTCLDFMQHYQCTSLKLNLTFNCNCPMFDTEKWAPN